MKKSQSGKTLLIVNRHAGSIDKIGPLLETLRQDSTCTVLFTKSSKTLRKDLESYLSLRFQTFLCAGGDGTVHELINALGDRIGEVRLGVIPLGTGNDLARMLGVPLDPLEAYRLLKDSAQELRLDLLRVQSASHSTYCMNMASGGWAGEVERATTTDAKRKYGSLAYLWNGFRTMKKTQYVVDLDVDGQPFLRGVKVINVMLANARTVGGGYEVAPHADLSDGLIDTILVKPMSPTKLLRAGISLLRGNFTAPEEVIEFKARRIELRSHRQIPFSLDGKVFVAPAKTTVRASILPSMVRILVPLNAEFKALERVG